MHFGRFYVEKPLSYTTDKILVGNWFEDRCNYQKKDYHHKSTYDAFFTPKSYSAHDSAVIWEAKFNSEGNGPRIILDHDGRNYMDNYSSTYDLSYNHYPKLAQNVSLVRHFRNRMQRYEPEIDYAQNHGPVTGFGLLDIKKEQWHCDKSDPRTTATTTYEDMFRCPPSNERAKLQLPSSPCNPITWECYNKLSVPIKCSNRRPPTYKTK